MSLRVLLLILLAAFCLKALGQEADRIFVVFYHNSARLHKEYKEPLKRFLFKYGKDTTKILIVGFSRDGCLNPYHFTWRQMQNVVNQVKNARGNVRDIVMQVTPRYNTDTIELTCKKKGEWWYNMNKDVPSPPRELHKR